MQFSIKMPKLTVRSAITKLAYFSLLVYIVSAISCEMVENTAFISTIAIYLVFLMGVLFIVFNKRILVNPYVVVEVVFCLYVLLMAFAPNASRSMGEQVAYLLFTCTVLCLLVFWMSSRLEKVVPIVIAAYIIGALILVVRIVNAYGGLTALILYASKDGEYRVGNLLGNENAIGLFLSTGILCGLMFFIKSKKAIIKASMILVMLILGSMMLLTGSRKSLAFAIIGIILLVLFGYRKAKLGKRFSALIWLVAALAAIYIAITTLPIFSTIYERLTLLLDGFFGGDTAYETDQIRKMMVQKGLEAFYEKPLFGHGAGYSYTLFGTYSHNNFVELLMCYGLVGFCLYYGFYAVLVVSLLKQAMKSDLYAVFFFTYICIQLALGIGWVNYYGRPVQIISALAEGYLASIEINKRRELGKNEA